MSVGGLFRFLSKPISRWSFKKGDEYFKFYVYLFTQKYVVKYLRKRQKLGLVDVSSLDLDQISSIGISIADYSQNVILSGEKITRTHIYNQCCDISDSLEVQDLADFAYKLHKAASDRHGIVKAKVREYWLLRSPRLIIVFAFLLVLVFLLDYFYFRPNMTRVDIQTRFIGSSAALFFSLFMVYYRLPDSIASSVAQVMHGCYVDTKKSLSKRHKNKNQSNNIDINSNSSSHSHSNDCNSSDSNSDVEDKGKHHFSRNNYMTGNVYMFNELNVVSGPDGGDSDGDKDDSGVDINTVDGSMLL